MLDWSWSCPASASRRVLLVPAVAPSTAPLFAAVHCRERCLAADAASGNGLEALPEQEAATVSTCSTAPDPDFFTSIEGELEALGLHLAAAADFDGGVGC